MVTSCAEGYLEYTLDEFEVNETKDIRKQISMILSNSNTEGIGNNYHVPEDMMKLQTCFSRDNQIWDRLAERSQGLNEEEVSIYSRQSDEQ